MGLYCLAVQSAGDPDLCTTLGNETRPLSIAGGNLRSLVIATTAGGCAHGWGGH